jgi:hypothetical protein
MNRTFLLLATALLGCNQTGSQAQFTSQQLSTELINKKGKTISKRFELPEGYERKNTSGFGQYLRSLPLKQYGTAVHYYNGEIKGKPNVYSGVIDMEIGTKNLQQCADAVMRLRAEYLFHSQQADKIHFNFTNGFNAAYNKWSEGYRINVSGDHVQWVKTTNADNSYQSFRNYMDVVFSYAGTLSLSKELKPVSYNEMQIGDMLIKGGSPGHAVIVVDMAEDKQGKKIFMLAQSYMPAQDIQILLNPNNKELGSWYELDTRHTEIITPEWDFTTNDLKRFDN